MKQPKVRGMGRVFKRRSRLTGELLSTWWIAYHVDSKERRESSHSTRQEEATQLLTARLHAINEGTYTPPERERLTVGAILDGLESYYQRKGLRSRASAVSQAKAWRDTLGSVRALAVTTERLNRVIDTWQAAGVSAATINRRLSLVRRAYRLAKLRLDPARLDFSGDLFLSENSRRGRTFTADAYAAIHKALPPYLKDVYEFAYVCGTRKRQLALTTWAHWNPEAAELTWDADEVKAKVPHVLPLDGRALEIVLTRHASRRLHCRYVFHGPRCAPGRTPSKQYGCIGDFKKAWATACKRAGFPIGRKAGGYVFHNTRHTAVTNLVNAGVPAHEAMAVSGHRTRSVFDRYSIPLKDQTRAALRRQTAYLAAQRDAAAPKVVPLTKTQ